MKNGNALQAYTEELNSVSGDYTALRYFQEPIPAAIDYRFDTAVQEFMKLSDKEREIFQSSLTPASRALFGIYGHRAAMRANREGQQDLLRLGLIASVIANCIVPDNRRLEVGLAVYHHSAGKMGLNPATLFANAADYATADLALRYVSFGNRADVTLHKYGWKEVDSGDGIQFRYSWK